MTGAAGASLRLAPTLTRVTPRSEPFPAIFDSDPQTSAAFLLILNLEIFFRDEVTRA